MSTKIKINSQIFQDSNNTYYPKNEQEVSELIKQLYKSDSPTEIIGTNSKNYIGNKTQSANTLHCQNYRELSIISLKNFTSK